MSAYLSDLTAYLNQIISQISYVGNHLEDYPLIVIMVSLWIVIGAVSFLFRLSNN